MRNHITICEQVQSHEYQSTPATSDYQARYQSSKHIPFPYEDGWTQVGRIVQEALRLALQQTPPHKRAEGIEALAERGVRLTAEKGHEGLAGARA